MSKVLYIKANPKKDEQSRTFRIANAFVEAYKQHHPDDEIITLDLYKEGIDFLREKDVIAHSGESIDEKSNPTLKYAYQFCNADKYIFAEPLWNLGIPAILKAYFDYVSVAGITFKYTESGPVGLCAGKKAVNISTQGGDYSHGFAAELELGNRYIKTILGLFGITDFKSIIASNLDVIGMDVDAIVKKAIDEAREVAKTF
jgi:FMN-dependent NADH-azoreductase